MLKTTAKVEDLTGEILSFLSRRIKVKRLILYGSYCYGTPRKDSDFDIAVISEDFERMSILQKLELFVHVPIAIDSRIELKGFSNKDFMGPEIGSLLEIIKNKGKVIYAQ